MFNPTRVLYLLALVMFSSIASAQVAPTKFCSKPKWKRAITLAASPYSSDPLNGASQPVLAAKCRAKCQADGPCMAYEWTATGKKVGICERFSTGSMIHAPRKHAAGICKLPSDNGTIDRRCPPSMFWNPRLKKCQPKEIAPNDDSTNGNQNPSPNGCPEGWVYSPKTGMCSPGEITTDDDSTDGNQNPSPNGCPEGWVYSPGTGMCSLGEITTNDSADKQWTCSDFDDILSEENRERCESHPGCVFVPESVTWGRCNPRQEKK